MTPVIGFLPKSGPQAASQRLWTPFMKIYLDTIGCRLNQSEIEAMARGFRAVGHEIVTSAQLADMAVVNTCTVTTEAASDSRGKIRNIGRAGVKQIVVTG